MDELISVGASWCGFSQRQKAALEQNCSDRNGQWDAENSTCTLEDKKIGIVMCDTEKDNAVCQAVDGQVQGYPTWFEKKGNEISPLMRTVPERVIPEQQATVHFEADMCALPSMKDSAHCKQ